jgi:ribonucleoside-diphosphate reductase alpha chain
MLHSIRDHNLSTSALHPFRAKFSLERFQQKYAHEGAGTWEGLARVLVENVMRGLVPDDVVDATFEVIRDMKFIPGGRYLYYANRALRAWNNCFLFRSEEDSREDWARLSWQAESALMTGGGIGNDYSIYRGKNSRLGRTGGVASGPIPKMRMINEIGREVMQGGSRRSAIWAGLNWQHADIWDFMASKDWYSMPVGNTGYSIGEVKEQDFNFPAPLDMTNISNLYDDAWLNSVTPESNPVFLHNVEQACKTGEPGMAFNFGAKTNDTLRNACCEVTSEDDSDVCNLGSLNLSRIERLSELGTVVDLATAFLLCGTIRAHLPYEKVYGVREKNRRLGLGLMGVHEWLLQRGARYEVTPELHSWLNCYKMVSDSSAVMWAYKLGVSNPVAVRSIAPTGTIGILAGTTTGIEPLFATAYKRRYLKNGTDWHYQFVVEPAATVLVEQFGMDPESIETALDLAADPERRIKFQADVQDYVDMAISSTINLPAWGSDLNNEDKVADFAKTLAKYAGRLRGFTCYPDGSRGGQPLTAVPYWEAKAQAGVEFMEHDSCKGGVCGL